VIPPDPAFDERLERSLSTNPPSRSRGGAEAFLDCQREKNSASLDGLPGVEVS
jgi:hypothetical protein